jgi:hypothetical protein
MLDPELLRKMFDSAWFTNLAESDKARIYRNLSDVALAQQAFIVAQRAFLETLVTLAPNQKGPGQ